MKLKEQLIILNEIDLDHVEEPRRSQLILHKDNLEKAIQAGQEAVESGD